MWNLRKGYARLLLVLAVGVHAALATGTSDSVDESVEFERAAETIQRKCKYSETQLRNEAVKEIKRQLTELEHVAELRGNSGPPSFPSLGNRPIVKMSTPRTLPHDQLPNVDVLS